MNICYNTNFPVYFSSSIPDKKIGTKARYCKLRKRETAIELRIGRRFEKLKNDKYWRIGRRIENLNKKRT
jgi:hypothetical protein